MQVPWRSVARETIPTTSPPKLLGRDGNGGNRLATDSKNIKVSTYLIRKGHTCTPAPGGWRVDGKFMDKWDVLDVVNKHRVVADLAPAVEGELE